MRVGGNAKCREFFESSPDYNPNMSIADKVRLYPLMPVISRTSLGLIYALYSAVHSSFRCTI